MDNIVSSNICFFIEGLNYRVSNISHFPPTDACFAGGIEMNVSFVSFPMVPAENNLFHHTGNPDLSAFTCDVSAVDPSGAVDCNITDVVNTNVKGVCHAAMCMDMCV